MRRCMTPVLAGALIVGMVQAGPARAEWCKTPLAQWSEAKSLEGSRDPRSPLATWTERSGRLEVNGLADRWSMRLLPDDPGPQTEVKLRFNVIRSSGRGRQLPGGCERWGFRWGENLPGWDVGVVLRWADPLHFYRVQISVPRGEVALWDSTGGFLQLVPFPLQIRKTHEARIVAYREHITVHIDGKPVMDYWDRALPHPKGRVGLAVWKSRTRIDHFSVKRLPNRPEPYVVPPHKPDFRLQASDGLVTGHPAFYKETYRGLVLFDGYEPISYFQQDKRGHVDALYQHAIKLKPGFRASYYTWIGPMINTWEGERGGQTVMPMVEDLSEALKVEQTGEVLRFKVRKAIPEVARADHVCTVRYDATRNVYRYEWDSRVTFDGPKPYRFRLLEITDPVTYNNRSPGDGVVSRWHFAGHAWNLYQGPEGNWLRYPLIDYLTPKYNNQKTRWGRTTDILYPDPGACPAFEVELKWKPPADANRYHRIGLCHWGYDFHHTVEGDTIEVPPGTTRAYRMVFTAMPPAEAEAVFKQSKVSPKVAAGREREAVFEPKGTSFQKTCTRAEPTATMVWNGGTIDSAVGRKDSHSLRIDGFDSAGLHMHHYMIEQFAKRWWVRGWARSKGVGGRGLQLRVKYAAKPLPEDVFYLGGRGDRDWTYFSFITEVPRVGDTTDVTFEMDGPGQVWLDDVAFTALTGKETPETTEFPMPEGLEPRTDRLVDLPMTRQPTKAVYDESRNGHNLHLAGPTWQKEKGRGFLRFDGVDDGATIRLAPALYPLDVKVGTSLRKALFPLKAFSYEFWVRPDRPVGTTSRMTILNYRWNPKVYLDQLTGETCRLVFQNNLANGPELSINAEVAFKQWHHVVATHGNGRVVLYVDGKKSGEAAYDPKAEGFDFFAYRLEYHVGCYYGKSERFCGDLGPLRLYTRALTAEEVQQHLKTGWPKAE